MHITFHFVDISALDAIFVTSSYYLLFYESIAHTKLWLFQIILQSLLVSNFKFYVSITSSQHILLSLLCYPCLCYIYRTDS